jgi:hypothetical protein
VEDFKLTVEKYPFCESCGDLEKFDVTFDDGGTTWCLDCAGYDDDFKLFTKEELKKAEVESYEKKFTYYVEQGKKYEELYVKAKGELE